MGNFYSEGIGVEKDASKAFEWFKKAAEQGNAEAQFFLGRSYFEGSGVEEDPQKAMEWLEKAAEQGNADAQNKLGEWNIRAGVETRKAFELFKGQQRAVRRKR